VEEPLTSNTFIRSSRPGKRAAHTVIDLFAGCGGLSLGLERAGFRPVYVNELGVDAMATYLANRVLEYPDLARYRSFDIFDVTGRPEQHKPGILDSLSSDLRDRHGRIDLVVGGPPCQGFSGIGHRRTFTGITKRDIGSNHLYREMARFIGAVQPKLFVFENVKGLLSGRWGPEGTNGEIWADVQKSFRELDGYEVHAQLVQAKHYGVPQNRPRVLLVGIHRDLGFVAREGKPAMGLLPDPVGVAPDPEDFLGDLVDPSYPGLNATTVYPRAAVTSWQEHFRSDRRTGRVAKAGEPITEHQYSHHHARIVEKFEHMIENAGAIRPGDQTRKFAQRVIPRQWGADGPTLTATSIPDDYVHFEQPRILTVREWARMQTFPDWYQFAGKRTTGGRRRAGDPSTGDLSRELPKYTQIGNAVPVKLAEALGKHLREFLD
jgi:DNA (cytosine-5)-methyltransferase 1